MISPETSGEIFTSWAGENFKIGDDELLLMREEDVLAVIED